MSESLGLGKIITTPQSRDAIHIAVAPVTADENLSPGAWVGFTDKSLGLMGTFAEPIGIVDPFLKNIVIKGQKFWLYLQPGSIVSLRHEWLHPAFDEGVEIPKPQADPEKEAAEKWLRAYAADEVGCSFKRLITGAEDFLDEGDYMVNGGQWEEFRLNPEFWNYFDIYTGRKTPENKRRHFFSCSC